jgi:transcriptional regulator with XRE-family HTH domain
MDKEKSLTEGEALLLLVRRSGKSGVDVAELLNIHPNHLSKLYKSERLTSKLKNRAAQVFGVPLSAFDVGEAARVSIPDMVEEPRLEYKRGVEIEDLTAAGVLRYLEEKDRWFEAERARHFEERARLLGIIENLTKK